MWFWRPGRSGDEEGGTRPGAGATPAGALSGASPPLAAPRATGAGASRPSAAAAVPEARPPALQPPPPQGVPGVMRPSRGLTNRPIPGIASPGGTVRPTRLSRELDLLLASLGPTRGDVAAALEAAGVRATPRDARCTPVAFFLQAVVGADPNVRSVTVDASSVVVELRAWWRSDVVVDLPPVIHEFTAAFDEGCYPALLPPRPRAQGQRGQAAEGPGARSD